LERLLHKTIKGVNESIASIDKLNTSVSRMMEFVNLAGQTAQLPKPIITTFLRVLAPFAPHIAEELWARLGESGLIVHAAWPSYDEALAADAIEEAPVQINGKLRAVLKIDAQIDNSALQALALQDERIQRYIKDKTVTRVIVTPNRLVNIMVDNQG